VRATEHGRELLADGDGADYYFVHSFVARPASDSTVAARCLHGQEFAAVVAAGPIVGFQFHPEKSGPAGLALLRRGIELAAGGLS
jgi:imidazoleglycerol phosphate synthase glutamine amidotransferase subunit HisH